MLNDLVNSTGPYCSSYNKIIDSCVCDDIAELFECYNEVKSQSDENSCALQKLSTYINCDNGNIEANNISASSASINGILSCGISSDSITANSVCAKNKLETECVEVKNITADSLNVSDISASNLTGLRSLTVEGQATVDKLQADEIETAGKVTASAIETTTAEITTLASTNIDVSNISAVCVDTDSIDAEDAVIENACIGKLSTSCFSSDEIKTSKISSTSLSVPKLETSGGITGKGTIDVTSSVWKEIRIPLFTGTIQFYTDEWKVTVTGGREFIWEDESLDHLKFISNDGETVTIAVDWDGEVYYTYDVAKNEPIISLVDNTGHIQANDYTYIMQDSGIKRGTVLIYQDREFTNQGLTILGKVKASNLEITCGESIDCLCVGNLCVGNSIISNNPIEVDICARSFCVSSPCTYIDNCLYADHLEAKCICTHRLYFDNIQVVCEAEKPKKVVVYKDGLLCSSCKVCADDDTVYSPKVCITGSPLSEGKSGFYGNLHGIADNSCCFDGRLFCDACFEILSGKACTAGLADNSCCFEGRTFAKACNEILSGKACKAELADFAQRTCLWCRWGQDDPGCYGYIPFADYVDKCLFFGRGDPNMANPFIVYNSYGLVCMELRGCLCLKDRPLIVDDSIDSDYMHTGWLKVKQNALITELCSCNEYTERLCVNQCAKFHGPTYFYGNIYQCGASYCTHAQNIYTCSDTITMREGADFAGDAQIKVLKYDGTNNGVIQLGTDGTLRIGDEANCQPVLTRSEEADITDGHVLVWDATAQCAKDGGEAIVTCDYVHCVGTECKTAACEYTVSVGTQCKTAACNYATSVGGQCKNVSCAFAVSCGHGIGTSCKNAACTYAASVGGQCKNAACAFAVSCAQAIGTACKNAAASTKADCYGNNYNCVQCAELARKVILEPYTQTNKRFIYVGDPAQEKNIGCNANFWFCPTCNVMAMGSACGSAICLVGVGSCCMSGACTKLNPKVVFSATDGQCGCLQFNQYDAVHPGAGLCWTTNTANTWFQTDCVYANKYLDKDGNQLGGYCATVGSPSGTTRYVLLDLSKTEAMVDFQVHNNTGTIVKTSNDSATGNVIQLNNYGVTGYYPVGTLTSPNTCFWLRINGWRPFSLWGSDPIKVVANTTTNPGCTWQSPTILPTCGYVTTIGSQCKSASCSFAASCGHTIGTACVTAACNYTNAKVAAGKTAACDYATSRAAEYACGACDYSCYVGGKCKSAACTYANTAAFCNVNTCRGIGVMGVARAIDAQCWTKAGYWAYMTTKEGPNCCWNHVIKTDWSAGVDVWTSAISIPTYNAPQAGIHYKIRCCAGTSSWTLIPSITCVQSLGLSCRSIAEACACAFAATCAQSVVPETSTFAKCYGNSTNCVAYADQIRFRVSSNNTFYKIPFTATITAATNEPIYVDGGNVYPSYNPSTNVFCAYTVCVAQSLAVNNANGGFRLGNYCIYIA